MPFSERIKLEAKRKSHFRCCICRKKFIQVHHIVPESEGGENTLNNAATLCASCHDLYGGNPDKRKQIREMRDQWWKIVDEMEKEAIKSNNFEKLIFVEDKDYKEKLREKAIALYHIVYGKEGFEEAAKDLFELVKGAQEKFPNKRRILYLDIENHLKENGAYDHDMYELQRHFILGFLSKYLSVIHTPLISFKTKSQDNDVPNKLKIINPK